MPQRGVDVGSPLSGLISQWIAAIVASAVVGFVMGGVAYALRQAFDLTSPDAGGFVTFALFSVEIVTAVPSFAVYADRTGAVLRQQLPAFPALTWYALHVLVGIAVGVTVAYAEIGSQPAPYQPPTLSEVLSAAFGGIIAGAFLGAVLGLMQASVLRKAARTVVPWVGWSTLGGMALAMFALALYIPGDHSIASEILTLGLGLITGLLAGMALIPAVLGLQPR